MPLEAVMVCIDNSDFTRNGDYIPTRYAAQTDAVNIVCNAKTQQNMENSVGMLTTAGDRVEVIITPSTDLGKMINELQKVQIKGSSDILRGIQTAQLALKHRQNKNQKQRIVAFVGSPIAASEKEMETLGKNLKKNNVSLDLVSFGEVEENTAKLEKLLAAVNSNDSSHILEIPVGPKMLSDVLLSSAIISPDGETHEGGMGGGDGFGFGIDPNEDPELALALRISMEEDRQRQEQQAASEAVARGEPAPAAAPAAEGSAGVPAAAAGGDALPIAGDAAGLEAMMGMEDMDDELRQALLLSLQESNQPDAPPAAAAVASAEPALAAAPAAVPASAPAATPIAAEAPAAAPAAAPAVGEEEADAVDAKWFQDPSFVQELLGQLPGVDINDPRIQEALKEVGGDEDSGEKKDGDASGSGTRPQ